MTGRPEPTTLRATRSRLVVRSRSGRWEPLAAAAERWL